MGKFRARYPGRSRKLVVAFDIGTSFSGAAYALLEPGEVPRIRSVKRYQNYPNTGSAKVPSILRYDENGKFLGVGSEDYFQDDSGLKVERWKLHLSPTVLPAAIREQMVPELPRGKTIIDVYADFMGYLFESTKEQFETSELNGKRRPSWRSASRNFELILTHPNGWGGLQQAQLRAAAVKAGIVPDNRAGHSRVQFVTDGEASFSFCATRTQAGGNLKSGEKVLIIDAGGGTIDISTYKVLSDSPLRVEELYESKCLYKGGDMVTAKAKETVEEMLEDSEFDTPEHLEAISKSFNEGLKKVFSDDQRDYCVEFGSPEDDDPDCGIEKGKLMLTGEQVAEFFEPSIRSTVDCIRNNFRNNFKNNTRRRPNANSFAFLVGGFAMSPWLSEQLQTQLLDIGFQFSKPATDTDGAVAIGAISYYVSRFVTARVSKYAYGVPYTVRYNPENPQHTKRKHKVFANKVGVKRVPGRFQAMLKQGAKIVEHREIRHSFYKTSEGTPPQHASIKILKYTGSRSRAPTPKWVDVEKEKFETLCHIKVDISAAPYITKYVKGKKGYRRRFDVILLVGLTELQAQVCWIDSKTGKETRSPAVIVYDNPEEET